MLVIMLTLEEWCQYLMGAAKKFEICTDHQHLQYFKKPQKFNHWQTRWITELAEYEFKLEPGKTYVKPNILPRWPNHERGEKDIEYTILLKPWHFQCQEFIFKSLDDNFIRWIHASRDRVVERVLINKDKDWREETEGTMMWKQHIHVPQNKWLWEDIIREHHGHVTGGHLGWYKTQDLITSKVYYGLLKTHSVSEMGHVSLGTVVHFGTPQHTTYQYCGVAGIHGYVSKVIWIFL